MKTLKSGLHLLCLSQGGGVAFRLQCPCTWGSFLCCGHCPTADPALGHCRTRPTLDSGALLAHPAQLQPLRQTGRIFSPPLPALIQNPTAHCAPGVLPGGGGSACGGAVPPAGMGRAQLTAWLGFPLRCCSKAPSQGGGWGTGRVPRASRAVQEIPVACSPEAHLVAAARPPPALRVGRGCGRAGHGFGAAPLWKWWDLISGWLESRFGRASEDMCCYFQVLCSICLRCAR